MLPNNKPAHYLVLIAQWGIIGGGFLFIIWGISIATPPTDPILVAIAMFLPVIAFTGISIGFSVILTYLAIAAIVTGIAENNRQDTSHNRETL